MYVCMYICMYVCMYIYVCMHVFMYVPMFLCTCVCMYVCIDVSVAEWLAWLTSNCGRICAIGSSPSNGPKGLIPCASAFMSMYV